jgi:hypothetical protein
MKQLKYFILGIVFYVAAIPIIESLAESAVTALELLKGYVSKPVLKLNKQIQELQAEIEPIDTHVMGFDITTSEDYDEDDFEDKKRNKRKRH